MFRPHNLLCPYYEMWFMIKREDIYMQVGKRENDNFRGGLNLSRIQYLQVKQYSFLYIAWDPPSSVSI